MDFPGFVALVIIGVASIRADVILTHISRSVEIIAAAKVKRVAPKRESGRFMQAHPNGKPIVK